MSKFPAIFWLMNSSLDSILDDFEINQSGENQKDDSCPITLWIPVKYKERFAELQEKSNKRFGKKLKEVIMRSIDKVYFAS